MKKYIELGEKIRAFRDKKAESISDVAKAINVDRTYLSKLENGHERPSEATLNQLISHFSLSMVEAAELSWLAGYEGKSVSGKAAKIQKGKEVFKMEEKQADSATKSKQVQVKISDNNPVLYSDSVFVTSSQWGIVFDFAQVIGPTNQQNVVARIGMSKEHAKALFNVLGKKLKESKDKPKK